MSGRPSSSSLAPGRYGMRFCDCHAKRGNKGKGPFDAHTLADVVQFRWNDANGHLIADLRCGAIVAWGVPQPVPC